MSYREDGYDERQDAREDNGDWWNLANDICDGRVGTSHSRW